MTNRVRKAVFPVGGMGTRFLPATKALPKEMLPVVDKPLIQYAVEEAEAAGIDEFIFVTGRGKSAIENHFDYSYELNDMLAVHGKDVAREAINALVPRPGQVAYIRQPEPLGLGHAVWCARHLIHDEPFAVLLADDLVLGRPYCLEQMITAYSHTGGNIVAVEEVPPEQTNRYGIVEVERDDDPLVAISGLVEKPDPSSAPSNLAIIGRYVLQPGVFEHLSRQERGAGGEIQLTDALAHMIGTMPFHGFRFVGKRFDCGDKAGFFEANLAFALERDDLGDEVRRILRRYAGHCGVAGASDEHD